MKLMTATGVHILCNFMYHC